MWWYKGIKFQLILFTKSKYNTDRERENLINNKVEELNVS